MSELPSYCHLTPTQIGQLSFRVTIHSNNELLLSQDIVWQARIPLPSNVNNFSGDSPEENRISLFTYTNADAKDTDSHRAQLNDRLLREDPCQIFVLMAAVKLEDSADFHNETLCVIKIHQSGLVSACPAFSQAEPEDCDNNSVFISDRAINEVTAKGPRLTAYSFSAGGSIYDYTVECRKESVFAFDDQAELMISEQTAIQREAIDERRRRIRKEFETYDCLYEKDMWDNQAHVELVSANGFEESNLLLSAPHGSSIVVRYRVLKPGRKEDEMLLDGTTTSVRSYPAVRGSLMFVTYFVVAFIGIAFGLLLLIGENGRDFSRTILLSIVPLALIIQAAVLGDRGLYHLNHQFSLLFNRCQDDDQQHTQSPQHMVLELRAYFKHNFGVLSLAGCGSLNLPSEPGTYEFEVPTWKPVACSTIGERKCRMYDFYLGSCLSEIGPLDPVPTSEGESELMKEGDVKLFSKGGLLTDGSGSITVRVNVMRNYFKDNDNHTAVHSEESHQHRVKLRETVDEVLSRVRRNKRSRMARVYNSSSVPSSKDHANSSVRRRLDAENAVLQRC